jgi:hypothetical protein
MPKSNTDKWQSSIIFFYKNSFDRYSRIKLRNVLAEPAVGDKVTQFMGKTRKFDGYFAATQQAVLGDHAIAVEGEFDVLALYSLVLRDDPEAFEPIYSFSGGSNLSRGVDGLKELGIENIYVFPDNDSAGIDYVNEIADIHAHTFIMSPLDYAEKEDPAEWSKRHNFADLEAAFKGRIPAYNWIGRMYAKQYSKETPENQSEARGKIMIYAKKLAPTSQEAFLKEFAPLTGVSLEALQEEILETTVKKYKKMTLGVDFGVHMQAAPTGKKSMEWVKISNFIPEHKYDILFDDGNQARDRDRSYVIDLQTKDRNIPVTISNTEYNDDKRLQTIYQSKLGSLGQITPKMISYLRDASLNFFAESGEFKEEVVYSHTGWNGERYLMPNCYIDENGYSKLGELKVELPPNLGIMFPYGLEEPYQDMGPIRDIILNDLLTMFPYSVTLPTIAHTFLTPLLNWMPDQSPYALWLHGITGTFKSTFASLMLAFNGKNSGANGLISMNSTVNAIEKIGYHLKDVVIILDDYKKSVVKDELLVRLIQNYGGRQGRSRLTNRSELQQTFFIRGNVIVTAEDTPTGESSVTARTLLMPIPCYPDMTKLNKCQANSHHFSSLYAKYIEFILDKRKKVDFSQMVNTVQRAKFQTKHHRVNTNLTLNSVGWEMFAEFMGCQHLSDTYYKVTGQLADHMNDQTKKEQASNLFIDALLGLLSTGKYYLAGRIGMMDTPHDDRAIMLGYIDKEYVRLAPAAFVEVRSYARRRTASGNGIMFSDDAILDQLSREGLLVKALDGRPPAFKANRTTTRWPTVKKEAFGFEEMNCAERGTDVDEE